jgi:IclR family pca regulon transcriptional regulator
VERYRSSRPGQQEIDLNLHVGARLPGYCTAMGKAILAFLPGDRLAQLIRRIDFEQRGPNTITDRRAFREELARIHETGIAAPVLSHTGEPIAAVNLAVHRTMASMDELLAHYGPAVTAAADAISESLGHRP